ncbi:MAG: MFS transporter [Bdellovibrionaceae bacterium]|nr:MFS transporter [Bdellovibrio sp.]
MTNRNKIQPFFYGFGEIGAACVDIFLKVYLLVYFNHVLGLPATWASLAIGASVLWDAIIDPWIGIYSDYEFRVKGHRKRVLYVGAIAITTLFIILWRIHFESQWLNLIFLFLISACLNSAISLFSVPYYALANDLEPDNEKRKSWIGWRLIFFNIGSLIGLAIPALYLTSTLQSNQQQPYLDSVNMLALIMVTTALLSVFLIYRNHQKGIPPCQEVTRNETLKQLINDKTFVQIIAASFIVNCGLGLNSSLALYYYKLYLNFTEKQTQIILVSFLLIFTLSIPLWVLVTKYFNKRALIRTAILILGALTLIAFPRLEGVPFWMVFAIASGVGGVLIGVAVVLEIYFSDFLKVKEDKFKKSVSGQYLGLWKMASKISRAVAIALAGPIIDSSAGHPQILANYFGGVVGFFFLFSGAILFFNPGNDDFDKQKISTTKPIS